MIERKDVKLKVNMHEDTKFKIIDMKPERDLIHYIWIRFLALAGKVNLEGNLYMSKNIPYTIETLAIEFNRGINQIKLALDVFMELEMIEITENNIYRVKNFVKHQNIKVKETIKSKNKEEETKIKDIEIKENSKNEIYDNQSEEAKNKKSENKVEILKENEGDNLELKNKVEKCNENKVYNLEFDNKDVNKIDNTICDEKINNQLKGNIPIVLEEKKKKKVNKSKSENNKNTANINGIEMMEEEIIEEKIIEEKIIEEKIIEEKMFEEKMFEENEDDIIVEFYDGDEGRPLEEGESIAKVWSFS